jgi:hypothetical protein
MASLIKKEGKGIGSSAMALGVGGASFYAATKAAQNISFLQSRWYATPIALAVVGHVAKRWSAPAGTAAIGAAGALFAFSYFVNQQPSMNPPANPPAQGLRAGDAGALVMGPGEAGALQGVGRQMRQFRGGYAGRNAPSRYHGSMAGMLVS